MTRADADKLIREINAMVDEPQAKSPALAAYEAWHAWAGIVDGLGTTRYACDWNAFKGGRASIDEETLERAHDAMVPYHGGVSGLCRNLADALRKLDEGK